MAMVMVMVVVPPTARVEAANPFVTVGAATAPTVRLAVAVVPVKATGAVAAIVPLVLV